MSIVDTIYSFSKFLDRTNIPHEKRPKLIVLTPYPDVKEAIIGGMFDGPDSTGPITGCLLSRRLNGVSFDIQLEDRRKEDRRGRSFSDCCVSLNIYDEYTECGKCGTRYPTNKREGK